MVSQKSREERVVSKDESHAIEWCNFKIGGSQWPQGKEFWGFKSYGLDPNRTYYGIFHKSKSHF